MSHTEWTPEEGGYRLKLLEEGGLHNVQLLIRPRFDTRAQSTLIRYAIIGSFDPYRQLASMVDINPILAMLPSGGFSLLYPDPLNPEKPPKIVPIAPSHVFRFQTLSIFSDSFYATEQSVFQGHVSVFSTDILQIAGQLRKLEEKGKTNMPSIRRIADYWVTADVVVPE